MSRLADRGGIVELHQAVPSWAEPKPPLHPSPRPPAWHREAGIRSCSRLTWSDGFSLPVVRITEPKSLSSERAFTLVNAGAKPERRRHPDDLERRLRPARARLLGCPRFRLALRHRHLLCWNYSPEDRRARRRPVSHLPDSTQQFRLGSLRPGRLRAALPRKCHERGSPGASRARSAAATASAAMILLESSRSACQAGVRCLRRAVRRSPPSWNAHKLPSRQESASAPAACG